MNKKMGYLEAISILECMAIDMTEAIIDLPRTNPMYDVIIQRLNAIAMSQIVLREKMDEAMEV